MPPDRIAEDLERNRFYFAQASLPPPENFAYPYGCVNLRSKTLCARHFTSCRGIQPGTNRMGTDLNLLRSVPFYATTLSAEQTCAAIDDVAQNGGWLTFFTHSVTAEPDAFDTTPDHLELALSHAAGTGVPVLPVREALRQLYALP